MAGTVESGIRGAIGRLADLVGLGGLVPRKPASESAAFTMALVGLAAKMAKADGVAVAVEAATRFSSLSVTCWRRDSSSSGAPRESMTKRCRRSWWRGAAGCRLTSFCERQAGTDRSQAFRAATLEVKRV